MRAIRFLHVYCFHLKLGVLWTMDLNSNQGIEYNLFRKPKRSNNDDTFSDSRTFIHKVFLKRFMPKYSSALSKHLIQEFESFLQWTSEVERKCL